MVIDSRELDMSYGDIFDIFKGANPKLLHGSLHHIENS